MPTLTHWQTCYLLKLIEVVLHLLSITYCWAYISLCYSLPSINQPWLDPANQSYRSMCHQTWGGSRLKAFSSRCILTFRIVYETTVCFMAQSSDFKQLPLVLNALASTPQRFLALSHCLMSICVISLKANQRIIISRQSILVSFSSLSLCLSLSHPFLYPVLVKLSH